MEKPKWSDAPRFLVALIVSIGFLAVFSGGGEPKKAPAPAPIVTANAGFVVQAEKILDSAHPKVSNLSLKAWQTEILPWFVEEGVTQVVNTPKPEWRTFEDDSANHILGQCDCKEGLWINSRFMSPVSPWFRDISFVSTMAHELVHAQQGEACNKNEREPVESTAQIVSLEILAAMANNGSRDAALSLVEELQSIVLGEMSYRSLNDAGAKKALMHLYAQIDDSHEAAERAQRRRYWEARPSEREFVLSAYAHQPYEWLVKALETGGLQDLALQPVFDINNPGSQKPPAIRFDDLQYFVSHMEEIVNK